VTIVTAEGDTVTLSSSSQIQATYMTYDGMGRVNDGFATFQGERLRLDANRERSIQIEGDLSKQELKDIHKALKIIDRMVRGFLSGDPGQVLASALKIGGLESVSSLEASLQFEERTSLERRFMSRVLSPPTQPAPDVIPKASAPALGNLEELTDNVTQVIEESGVNPSKIANPLRKLFAHLSKELFSGSFPQSPQREVAKLIQSKLLDSIEELSERYENRESPEADPDRGVSKTPGRDV
jgi:hypothetical protein